MTRPTSAQAYLELRNSGDLGRMHKHVLDILWDSVHPRTAGEIARAMDKRINSVSPRLAELKRRGLVTEAHNSTICQVTGRRCLAWELNVVPPTSEGVDLGVSVTFRVPVPAKDAFELDGHLKRDGKFKSLRRFLAFLLSEAVAARNLMYRRKAAECSAHPGSGHIFESPACDTLRETEGRDKSDYPNGKPHVLTDQSSNGSIGYMKNTMTLWKFSVTAAKEVIAPLLTSLADKAFGINYAPSVNNQVYLSGYANERADVQHQIEAAGAQTVTGKQVYAIGHLRDGNVAGFIAALEKRGLNFRIEHVPSFKLGYGNMGVNGLAVEFFNETDYALAENLINEWSTPQPVAA